MDKNSPDIKGKFLAVLVPPSFSSLPTVRRYLDPVAQAAKLNASRAHDLKVAVSEAVANAIEHGTPDGAVHLKAEITDERIVVCVTSQGSLAKHRPTVSRRHRGMGLPIMAALSDGIRIESGKGQVRVILVFELCSQAPETSRAQEEPVEE